MSGKQLDDALIASQAFDERSFDAYGLFDAQFNPLGGQIRQIPPELGLDGRIHELSRCLDADDPRMPKDSCDAVALKVRDGRWLVLVRDNGSLFVVTRIILHALLWGLSLTIIPGIAGWYLLRRRPLKRIRAIQASAELIVAGDLTGSAACTAICTPTGATASAATRSTASTAICTAIASIRGAVGGAGGYMTFGPAATAMAATEADCHNQQ